ncbi:hypothetical protein IMZ31_06135 [Pontibacillus sp. ALD_SL1]|uniref:hypothetical protein n=1 Tax=Pontibacillus sp. ALD_SL1 TaxID=2777185 RepID=UPI001A965558|nr:hypothetical protein [Pontibacillus sp. ALD_SL1]QST01139.1 hypothetical protein IMZ31_06135 [Pontibacillus sp. ALD_SL1]
MKPNKSSKENAKSPMKKGFARTDPQKVKQDIQKDLEAGIGDMTSREAGSMRN